MIRNRRLLFGVGALTLAVGLGACGSSKPAASNSTGSPTEQASSSVSAQASGAPIKVGVICSCSGAFGVNFLAALDVYKAFVQTTNAAGGINGHQIDLIVDDDAGVPGNSAIDAQKLISAHVDAILDESILDQIWAAKVQSANIPVVGGNATEDPMYQNPDFYPQGTTNDQSVTAVAATAKSVGATNVGFLYCAEAPSCAEGAPVLKVAAAKVGIADIYSGEVSGTAPNYTSQCVAMKEAHVQSVFIGDGASVILRIAADCQQQGFKPIYLVQGEGVAENELDAPGISADLSAPYNDIPFWANTPGVTAMNAALAKYYPKLKSQTASFTELAAMAWPAGLLLVDAVKGGGLTASGTPSPSEIVTGLESLKADTLDGTAPPLTFAAGKPHSVDCWFLTRDINGTSTLENNGQAQCATGTS